MVTVNVIALLTVTAVVAFASSAVVIPRDDDNSIEDSTPYPLTSTSFPDLTDDEDDDTGDVDNNTVIDGVLIKYLSEEEFDDFLDEEDENLYSEIDINVARKIANARSQSKATVGNIVNDGSSGGRAKRWLGVAFRIGRALFKGAARYGRPTPNGMKLTQQYKRPGTYSDAVRDFYRMRPDKPQKWTSKTGVQGITGTVGRHRVTVRDWSKSGEPTISIGSPRPNGRTFERKFRYTGPQQ